MEIGSKGGGDSIPKRPVSGGLAAKIKSIDGKSMKPRRNVSFVSHNDKIVKSSDVRTIDRPSEKIGSVNSIDIVQETPKTAEVVSMHVENPNSEKVVDSVIKPTETHEEKQAQDVVSEEITKEDEPKTFASVVRKPELNNRVHFRKMETKEGPNGEYDVMIPIQSVKQANDKLCHSIYGYFIGKRIAFPIVEQYVLNAWAKFGIRKVMMNAHGFFFFKFDSDQNVDDVLQNGPWMIRNSPIILNKWNPSTVLVKENLKTVPVWMKLHDVPLAAFTADGLSMIASKLGNPLMMDSYTSDMCVESWGRSSYARVMVEVSALDMLKDKVSIAIPNVQNSSYVCTTIRVEYEWKPPQCPECKIFGHSHEKCPKNIKVQNKVESKAKTDDEGFQVVNRKKKNGNFHVKPKQNLVYRPVQKTLPTKEKVVLKSTNPFDILQEVTHIVDPPVGVSNTTQKEAGESSYLNDYDKSDYRRSPIRQEDVLHVNDDEEEDSSDEEDVEVVYDETKQQTGASTPESTVAHV